MIHDIYIYIYIIDQEVIPIFTPLNEYPKVRSYPVYLEYFASIYFVI